jgi:hypothetical protein
LKSFVASYDQMHRWGKIKAGGEVLQVGHENIPFPIPLGRNAAGRYYFDTAAGKDEILARRIGKNELTAMEASAALAGAEQEYFDKNGHYASRLVSDPGKQDGLFWPAAEGRPVSPMGKLGDLAKMDGANPEFNGYRFRILSKGGKDFAILAYPVEYRKSGIMSFLMGKDGTLYQKDLGEHTPEVAAAINDYNPGDGWTGTNAPVVGTGLWPVPCERSSHANV